MLAATNKDPLRTNMFKTELIRSATLNIIVSNLLENETGDVQTITFKRPESRDKKQGAFLEQKFGCSFATL